MEMESKSNSDIHVGGVKDYSFDDNESTNECKVVDKNSAFIPVVLGIACVFFGMAYLVTGLQLESLQRAVMGAYSLALLAGGLFSFFSTNDHFVAVARNIALIISSIAGVFILFVYYSGFLIIFTPIALLLISTIHCKRIVLNNGSNDNIEHSIKEKSPRKEFPNGRLAMGIVLISVSAFVGIQVFAALIAGDSVGFIFGLILFTAMITCGILAIITRNSRDHIICHGIGLTLSITGLVAILVKPEFFRDLNIWGVLVGIVGLFFLHCYLAIKSNNNKQNA